MLSSGSHCVGHCGGHSMMEMRCWPCRLEAQSGEWLTGWEAMASLTEASHWEQEPINTSGGSWWAAPRSQQPGWSGEMLSILGRQLCPCPVMTEQAAQLLRGMGPGSNQITQCPGQWRQLHTLVGRCWQCCLLENPLWPNPVYWRTASTGSASADLTYN